MKRMWRALGLVALLGTSSLALAQETVCARVKIEIKQELTFERQAFDAEMKIINSTDTGVIENVSVVVKVTDEAGTPVLISGDPNEIGASFFIRISGRDNISGVDGNGVVAPKTTSTINWLLIPAPGAAGTTPLGRKYLVGATLKYRYAGEEHTLDVSPDVITVKPQPQLTLDYFLTRDVWADDPLTDEVEAIEPFTLGVRVKNSGLATAKGVKIDSAQPKIVENNQGLLINFLLTGSYVDDLPVKNTLLIDFGDVAAGSSKMGRWNMETTLAGRFTEFTASFIHADELGGAMTSLLKAVNPHFLLRDVRVDLPGRDMVRDFLAEDGDVIRVYESDSADTEVTDRSATATLTAVAGSGNQATYAFSFAPTDGFVYARLRDPFNGSKVLGRVLRSDAKEIAPENVWLSKRRNPDTKQLEYFVHLFDVNSSGSYQLAFDAPPPAAQPPVLQFVPDRAVQENQQVSFLVEASSPDGKPLNLSAMPLPAGASFLPQAVDPLAPGVTRAIFDWTPPAGAAGLYQIVYTASDGALSASRMATIRVESDTPPTGPAMPVITAPLAGAQVTALRPTLGVQASTNLMDPTTQLQFELYADEAMTQLVHSSTVDKAANAPGGGAGSIPVPTTWQLPAELADNTHYWWRARAFDGSLYSLWVNGRFFVNTYNDAPASFNLSLPLPAAQVGSLRPLLSWTNSVDKDGDAISYEVIVYKNSALSEVHARVSDLPADASGSTSWQVSVALESGQTYFWRVIARDGLGAQTLTPARSFSVQKGDNTAPPAPQIVSPLPGGVNASSTAVLVVRNSVDAEGDLLTYVFEIDTVNTFDSSDRRSSGQVIEQAAGQTRWSLAGLLENKRYFWRVKAQDASLESAWVQGDFLVNAINEAPPVPSLRNPGNGAWVASLTPVLEANPVEDPDGETLRYEFEVYRDAALATRVAAGRADSPAWTLPAALQDRSTHWWRVRAVDQRGLGSDWSAPAMIYVSTGNYQAPSIAVLTPALIHQPALREGKRLVDITWEGSAPAIEASVALYYSSSPDGFAGSLIAEGLRQPAGTHAGSHAWDVSGLAPGVYYVYAVIHDAKGLGRAYAPGTVVLPNVPQAGGVVLAPLGALRTSEQGQAATLRVSLTRAPLDEVVMSAVASQPREAMVTPATLRFTPQNWSVPQEVVVRGLPDCMLDGNQAFELRVGPAVARDPDYMGLEAAPVALENLDDGVAGATTNVPTLQICGLQLVSERQVTLREAGGGKDQRESRAWEYVLRAEMANQGAAIAGARAELVGVPAGVRVQGSVLNFGAIGQGESGKSLGTLLLRSSTPLPAAWFRYGPAFRWQVTVTP